MSNKIQVGSQFCYAEFDTQEEADAYMFRAYPMLLFKRLEPITPAPMLCRIGLHDMNRRSETDGGFITCEWAYCKRCLRSYYHGGTHQPVKQWDTFK